MELENKIKETEENVNGVAPCADGEEANGKDEDTSKDDNSGRPNRGAGSAGPKNPGGGGNRDQYSLRNDNNE